MMDKIYEIPGPIAQRILIEHAQHSVTTTNDSPLVVGRAGKEGVYVVDVDEIGEFLEFTSGGGVSNTGYNHPEIKQAIQFQLETGMISFIDTDFVNPAPTELKKQLSQLAPQGYQWKVFLGNSGTEEIEATVKVCFNARPARTSFIACHGAFHGRTGYAIPLMSKIVHRRHFPLAYDTFHIPYPTTHDAEKTFEMLDIIFKRYADPSTINGLYIEFIQGEGGIVVPSYSAIQKLVKICREHGILIIADEIQAGMGRSGKWWAFEHFDVVPDMFTVAKAIASGVPMGAAVIRADLDFTEKGRHSNTFGGNLLASAAALATIRVIKEEHLIENAQVMGKLLQRHLMAIKRAYAPFVKEVRGIGLMRGIEIVNAQGHPFPKLRDAIIEEALKRGLNLMGSGHKNINPTIRFLPPLVIQKKHILKAIGILNRAFQVAKEKLNIA